jgi:hypothetical protein
MDVELCYRERSEATRTRYPLGPIHMTLPGAPRLLCDANAYVDTQHRPTSRGALTCKRCIRLVEKGDYQLPAGHGGEPSVAPLRLTLVIPPPMVDKLVRVSAARGLPYSKTLMHALYELPDVSGTPGNTTSTWSAHGVCTHPGQKVNHPRDTATIDRVCQTCHAVIETLPRCPGTRANGEQCRAFIRKGFETCKTHSR